MRLFLRSSAFVRRAKKILKNIRMSPKTFILPWNCLPQTAFIPA
jgi:hypothetical protein